MMKMLILKNNMLVRCSSGKYYIEINDDDNIFLGLQTYRFSYTTLYYRALSSNE